MTFLRIFMRDANVKNVPSHRMKHLVAKAYSAVSITSFNLTLQKYIEETSTCDRKPLLQHILIFPYLQQLFLRSEIISHLTHKLCIWIHRWTFASQYKKQLLKKISSVYEMKRSFWLIAKRLLGNNHQRQPIRRTNMDDALPHIFICQDNSTYIQNRRLFFGQVSAVTLALCCKNGNYGV